MQVHSLTDARKELEIPREVGRRETSRRSPTSPENVRSSRAAYRAKVDSLPIFPLVVSSRHRSHCLGPLFQIIQSTSLLSLPLLFLPLADFFAR